MISLPYKLLALALLVMAAAGAFFGYGHHQYVKGTQVQQAIDQVATDKIKLAAAAELAAQVAKTAAAEQSLRDFTAKQELKDANNQKVIAGMADKLQRSQSAGRLRDPNATPGCRLGGSGTTDKTTAASGAGAGDGAQTGGLFSEPATRLFERLTREADDINAAYQSCREYAQKVAEPTP